MSDLIWIHPNCLTCWWYSWKNFFQKTKKHAKFPSTYLELVLWGLRNFECFLSTADFIQNQLLKKIHSGINTIRMSNSFDLGSNCLQRNYQQMTLVGKDIGPVKKKKLCKIAIIFSSIILNMSFGCSKESSHWDGSFEYPQHMFWLRNKKNYFQLHTLIWGPVKSNYKAAKCSS